MYTKICIFFIIQSHDADDVNDQINQSIQLTKYEKKLK